MSVLLLGEVIEELPSKSHPGIAEGKRLVDPHGLPFQGDAAADELGDRSLGPLEDPNLIEQGNKGLVPA